MENFFAQLSGGQINFDSAGWLMYLLSFLGGVITSVSPCSIGLLPVIISFVIGKKEETQVHHLRSVLQIFFFMLGLSLTLTAVGVFCALTGKIFGSQAGPYWSLIMAGLILIFGLHMLDIIEIPMPVIVKTLPKNKSNNIILYPMLIGAMFAFATTPCSTPILAGILAYASIKANIPNAAILLFLFSLGQGMILVIAGLFTSLFKQLLKLNKVSGILLKISGVILVLTALFIYAKIFELF